jgi:predicted extracellular nuclease
MPQQRTTGPTSAIRACRVGPRLIKQAAALAAVFGCAAPFELDSALCVEWDTAGAQATELAVCATERRAGTKLAPGTQVRFEQPLTIVDATRALRQREVLVSPLPPEARGPLLKLEVPNTALADLAGLRLGASSNELRGVLHLSVSGAPALGVLDWPAWQVPAVPRPPAVRGALRFGALNLDNYFVTLGRTGARDAREFARQRAKLATALVALDVHCLALVEFENNSDAAADLLTALNAVSEHPFALVRAADPSGTLRSAIFYRSDRMQSLGAPRWLAAPPGERPPQIQDFSTPGGPIALVVVHFKSRLCDGALDSDAEGGCNAERREREAEALITALPQGAVLVVGDFNAEPDDPELEPLRSSLLRPLFAALPPATRYSYAFRGRRLLFDHAWASPPLAERANGAGIWHINADELPERDYRVSNPQALYADDARRCSDHDPLLLGFD